MTAADHAADDYHNALRAISAVAGDALDGCVTHHDLLSALRAVHAVAVDALGRALTVLA